MKELEIEKETTRLICYVQEAHYGYNSFRTVVSGEGVNYAIAKTSKERLYIFFRKDDACIQNILYKHNVISSFKKMYSDGEFSICIIENKEE